MKQFKALPTQLQLAPTLAQRIFQLRELRNMTVRDLAEASRFSINRIEDLESGLETWLSSADRQLLARALVIEPNLLKEVEYRLPASGADSAMFDRERCQNLGEAILAGGRDLQCPDCGSNLSCDVQEGMDMDERPFVFAKASCRKCPFVLR